MGIFLAKLTDTDYPALFRFEQENSTFFEQMVPPRPEQYQQFASFKTIQEELVNEQEQQLSVFYLIKDDQGNILGRINITDIDRENSSGQLGYRVGRAYAGRGIATQALSILIKDLSGVNINKLEAQTTAHNIGSQKVLEKHNFQRQSSKGEKVIINGQEVSFIYYYWSEDNIG
ncbi:ribosomal-protein-alanine N-acetyltransferase [Amphibacillus marinus]|uniref:Ribosomal-protein-alanine N-acetyltransferase n=1 Tax=Amphibacillus marinus TaxID=872970 RepID=A0A1H8K9Y1_9BACI|nr:GNAT family protein [Amphibacillus marinus]SEN89511.1 ribosomal-protein-alanine N-acetyltransferase [Amphibacillus marinus]